MIFLSYSWADSRSAHALHRQLTLGGWETWIDFERLDLGNDLGSQIEIAILASRTLLFLDTPEARSSPWTRFEIATAGKAKVPVLRIPSDLIRYGRCLD
jgi:hypothetical protein